MKHFYVIANPLKEGAAQTAERIAEYLHKRGATCEGSAQKKHCGGSGEGYTDINCIPADTQCVITLGGDGTLIQAESGRQRYVVMHSQGAFSDKYIRILKDGFASMDMAQNILVIKTVSGMAMAVAAALDAMHFHEIVGCIAGDDTIMCAVRSVDDTILVMDKIKKLVAE